MELKFDDVQLIKKKDGWTLKIVRNPKGVVNEEDFERAVLKVAKALQEFQISVRYTKDM